MSTFKNVFKMKLEIDKEIALTNVTLRLPKSQMDKFL